MEKIYFDLTSKSMRWTVAFSNCYIEEGVSVRGLTKTIKLIEKHGTLLTEELTSRIASYDIWGGKACIKLDGPQNCSYIQIDISHENLRELYFILQRLGLKKSPKK